MFGRRIRRWLLILVVAVAAVYFAVFVDFHSYPQQEWSSQMKQDFYFFDQGSKLVPAAWFKNIEVADGTAPFSQNLDRYGFIATKGPSDKNPNGWPIGFALHNDKDGQTWVGLTCAGCHTGRVLMPGGRELIIEGAQSLVDFDWFFADFVHAMQATLADEAKFGRFAAGLGTPVASLRPAFEISAKKYETRLRYNTPKNRAGFGRVDAFGQIFNQVTLALNQGKNLELPGPDAPASYPFVWDIPKHDRVQWNGSAPNLGVGHSGSSLRNIGEVLGVFGDLDMNPGRDKLLPNYPTSAVVGNLKIVESWLTLLASPQYPEKIDAQLAKHGGEIYDRECKTCHALVNRLNSPVPTPVQMTPIPEVGTEPDHAAAFAHRTSPTGPLEGHLTMTNPRQPFNRFGATAPTMDLTVNASFGAFYGSGMDRWLLPGDLLKIAVAGVPDAEKLMSYKARPLNGIWATSPYLHNGSVETLWELLQKPEERKPEFCVGNAIYDTKKVGYLDDCSGRSFKFDTKLAGNRNMGHVYGTGLSADDKWALIEFVKGL